MSCANVFDYRKETERSMADKNIALSHRPSPTLQEGDVGDAVQLRKHAKPHRLGLSDRVQAGKEEEKKPHESFESLILAEILHPSSSQVSTFVLHKFP